MANMIDLDSFRKLSYYSDFETRSLNVLELREGIFGPPPINPVNIEDSLINENWPRFNVSQISLSPRQNYSKTTSKLVLVKFLYRLNRIILRQL